MPASVCRQIYMSVNNFLMPIQVQLSPNFISHTLGYRDKVIKFWKFKVGGGGMRSTERAILVSLFLGLWHELHTLTAVHKILLPSMGQ